MELVNEYLSWLEHNKGRAERTAVKYRQGLDRLTDFLARRDRNLLTAELVDLEEFVGLHAHQELNLCRRARRPLVAAVRGFFTWAAKHHHILPNPADGLEYPKTGKRLPRPMTLQNAEKLLQQCDLSEFIELRDAAILSILIGCGLRVSGACSLNEEDLIWYQDDKGLERLALRAREKGDKERLVPAPIETRLYIHAYLGHKELESIDRTLESGEHVLFVSTRNRGIPAHEYNGESRRLAERSFFDRLRTYGEEAGIPDDQLHPHALRHLFGTELAEDDVDLLLRQELLGHESPKTTQIYTALAMRKKAAAIDLASPMRKIHSHVSALAKRLG